MTSAMAGELKPMARGLVYCRTVSACLDSFDYRRALEWTQAIDQCQGAPSASAFPGDCRTHRAAVFITRGAWAEAEEEAKRACEETATFDLTHAAAATYEIGEIRLRRGDLAGAETAFRRAHELGASPQPGLALLRLVTGDPVTAALSIAEALAEVPHDRLIRARLLPAQIEIALAGGSHQTARASTLELGELADAFDRNALHAAAACASGAIAMDADKDAGLAARSLRHGLQLWREVDAPYESAQAQLKLARALAALGDLDTSILELEQARSVFERLGAEPDVRCAQQAIERIAG